MIPEWALLVGMAGWFAVGVIVGKTWTWERKP